MKYVFACAALVPLGVAGCGSPAPVDAPSPGASLTVPGGRYAPRTDPLAVKLLTGTPARWNTPKFPPLRTVHLFPNTPDKELATSLREQFDKAILDPVVYEQDVWMPAQADRLTRLLDAHFGTPLAPAVVVPPLNQVLLLNGVRFDPEARFNTPTKAITASGTAIRVALALFGDWASANTAKTELKLDDATLARGSVVYRRWCMQCHGPSGAGDSAYAAEAGPMPRDYRQGVFKFVTAFPSPTAPKKAGLGAGGKARRGDLKQTVRNGIDGTIMPAFTSLTDAELEDVVSYVIHLSVRGETEFATLARAIKPVGDDPIAEGEEMDKLFVLHELAVLGNWLVAEQTPIPVPPEKAATEKERIDSAVRGYQLFNAPEFGCNGCHQNYGRAQQLKWDAWGTITQPRNLTLGVYRGGRTGADLYARIYGGIAPVAMPSSGQHVANAPPGTPDKIWDIVHFLQALADPADRKRMQEKDPTIKFDP